MNEAMSLALRIQSLKARARAAHRSCSDLSLSLLCTRIASSSEFCILLSRAAAAIQGTSQQLLRRFLLATDYAKLSSLSVGFPAQNKLVAS